MALTERMFLVRSHPTGLSSLSIDEQRSAEVTGPDFIANSTSKSIEESTGRSAEQFVHPVFAIGQFSQPRLNLLNNRRSASPVGSQSRPGWSVPCRTIGTMDQVPSLTSSPPFGHYVPRIARLTSHRSSISSHNIGNDLRSSARTRKAGHLNDRPSHPSTYDG